MLRKIIIIAAVVFIPIVFFFAAQYGEMETVTFAKAIESSQSATEGDKAPSVIVVATIVSIDDHDLYGEDKTGRQFKVDYTGSEPDEPFSAGQTVRFVGHVHGEKSPYFHALQVYGQ